MALLDSGRRNSTARHGAWVTRTDTKWNWDEKEVYTGDRIWYPGHRHGNLHCIYLHSIAFLRAFLDSLAVGLSALLGKIGSCKYKSHLLSYRSFEPTAHQRKEDRSHQHYHSKRYAETRDCSGNVSSVCPTCLAHGPLSSHQQWQCQQQRPSTASAANERGQRQRARPTITDAASNSERGQRKTTAASNITTMMYPFPIPSDRDLPKMPEEKGNDANAQVLRGRPTFAGLRCYPPIKERRAWGCCLPMTPGTDCWDKHAIPPPLYLPGQVPTSRR